MGILKGIVKTLGGIASLVNIMHGYLIWHSFYFLVVLLNM